MLTTLRIKNLALVSDLTLELAPGFTAITGETGAGKSIIIGALKLVLGDRADRNLIRSGAETCSVEAVFDIAGDPGPIASLLEENGLEPCEQNQLVVKRSLTAAGGNRQFVNGSPTTLETLAAIGEWLVDMHGPHDHQSLLNPARQLDILDAFGDLEELRDKFTATLKTRQELERARTELVVDEKTYAEKIDRLRFQAHEIETASLQPGELAEIEREHHRVTHSAKLLELTQAALQNLDNDDDSLFVHLGAIGRTLQELRRIDPGAETLVAQHGQIAALVHELQTDLSHYTDKIDVDPNRLQTLEDRLNLIHGLLRKYGGSIEAAIDHGKEARRQLQLLEGREAGLARLNNELAKTGKLLADIGRKLSAERLRVIPTLSKAASAELADLGFKQSHFNISRHDRPTENPSPQGADSIEFQFAPNLGEPPRPLRAIASSGEMSRVMLALKTVLASQDKIPVLVFDEIDANVGGETAVVVGRKMNRIASDHQVLCITHLPAVAAAARSHFVVSKRTEDGRTISEITRLDKKQRVTEVARMLGGQNEAARKHAESLLAWV